MDSGTHLVDEIVHDALKKRLQKERKSPEDSETVFKHGTREGACNNIYCTPCIVMFVSNSKNAPFFTQMVRFFNCDNNKSPQSLLDGVLGTLGTPSLYSVLYIDGSLSRSSVFFFCE